MLKNYILIAWRSLLKNKLFSFINIFGLALSMSVCMIVLIRITDAFEYDNFHPNKDHLYRVVSTITNHQGRSWTMASSPLPLASTVNNDSTPIAITRLYPAIHTLAKDAAREFSVNGAFIDPSFFDLFGFTLRSGNPSSLASPQQVMLSYTMAEKLYGTNDPTGKSISLGNWGEFTIAGVINKPPSKSHINYDVFVSMATVPALEQDGLLPQKLESWNSFEQGYTYIRVSDQVTPDLVKARLAAVASEINRTSKETNKPEDQALFEFDLQPVGSITPGAADIYNEIGRGPSRGSLLAESGIVLIILLAACFNYTNLSVARALTRSKEVGIRKLSGAQRWQIFLQYVTESVLIALFALLLANMILAPILEFKPFNDSYEMVPSVRISLKLFGLFVGFAIFAGLLAGSLPAWILSAFRPARILRGIGGEKLMGNLSFRKVLMVFQFSLSLIVLVFLATFYKQFDFIAHADPGYNRQNVVLVPAGTNAAVTETGFSKLAQVVKTGQTSASFGSGDAVKGSRQSKDKEALTLERYFCNAEWIEISKLSVLAGNPASQNPASAIVNERATVALGVESAASAVGATLYIQDSIPLTITAVVADFYSRGYGNPIQPLLLQPATAGHTNYIALQAQPADNNVIRELEYEWKKQNPAHAFEYISLDEKAKADSSQRAGISLLGFLSFMTVTISLLGLLGLVVYTVETRRKEVSIRKIIGASIRQVVTLLSGNFIKLLAISGLIALPIAYLLGKLFLMNFANRVTFGVLETFACFLLLLVAGLITILSQTWKAALQNPSDNLRTE